MQSASSPSLKENISIWSPASHAENHRHVKFKKWNPAACNTLSSGLPGAGCYDVPGPQHAKSYQKIAASVPGTNTTDPLLASSRRRSKNDSGPSSNTLAQHSSTHASSHSCPLHPYPSSRLCKHDKMLANSQDFAQGLRCAASVLPRHLPLPGGWARVHLFLPDFWISSPMIDLWTSWQYMIIFCFSCHCNPQNSSQAAAAVWRSQPLNIHSKSNLSMPQLTSIQLWFEDCESKPQWDTSALIALLHGPRGIGCLFANDGEAICLCAVFVLIVWVHGTTCTTMINY